jgi:hypothetical protein
MARRERRRLGNPDDRLNSGIGERRTRPVSRLLDQVRQRLCGDRGDDRRERGGGE